MKNVNACHENNSARKICHLVHLLMFVIAGNPDFQISFWNHRKLSALHAIIWFLDALSCEYK